MIIRAGTVVTMDGPPIKNGAVAVSGGLIVDVGTFDKTRMHDGGETIDLGEQALLPGLINAHCHLDYTCLRGKIPRQKSFSDWIRAINAEKGKLTSEGYIASINEGFAEAKSFGTTTIANLTAFPKLIRQIHSPIRTWWFAELIDVREPERANELVDSAASALRQTENCGLAPHTLFTASKNLYRRAQKIASRDNILLTTHLAESREEMQMFRNASGPLYEFLRGIGRPMNDCGNKTPLELFVGESDSHVCSRWIVVHLNELKESDFELLETSAHKFHIVHCPRSHDYFGHSRFPFERLRAPGFNICLGTDSLASNEDLSLFAEMRAFQKVFRTISPEDILRMITANAAAALSQENVLGRIRPGFKADLIAVPCSGTADVFEQIIAFDRPVSWAMVNGEVSRRR